MIHMVNKRVRFIVALFLIIVITYRLYALRTTQPITIRKRVTISLRFKKKVTINLAAN